MSITSEHITSAAKRIAGYVHKTPILRSTSLNNLCNADLHFKCENFQKIGAFKARGAFNFALQLTSTQLSQGLCTHSSGNHAQALALVAKTLGVKAYIVMPNNSPKVKIEAVKGYGASITFCEPTLEARETTLAKIQSETRATFVHPYNHEWIIAGQATSALELLDEVPNLDYIITPVGGGGLLAGTSLAAKYLGKSKVVGAEPNGADDAYRSFYDGGLVPSTNPITIADGLLTSLGEVNFEIIKSNVTEIFTCTEDEIIAAMRLIWERMKIIVEPSSAVTLAVLIQNMEVFKSKKVGIILSGGNVDVENLPF